MVDICDEYAHGFYDKAYIYCNFEESRYSAGFFSKGSKAVGSHKIGELSEDGNIIDSKLQVQVIDVLMEDLVKMRDLSKEYSREMPYEIKLVYDAVNNKIKSNYTYPPKPKAHEGLAAGDFQELWLDEISQELAQH